MIHKQPSEKTILHCHWLENNHRYHYQLMPIGKVVFVCLSALPTSLFYRYLQIFYDKSDKKIRVRSSYLQELVSCRFLRNESSYARSWLYPCGFSSAHSRNRLRFRYPSLEKRFPRMANRHQESLRVRYFTDWIQCHRRRWWHSTSKIMTFISM